MTVTPEHGGGVFAVARRLGLRPEELTDFSASINPLGPATGVREAIDGAWGSLVHYPDREACELRDALAAFHGLEGSRIAVANGSTELIHRLPRLVTGSRALVVAPAFSEYARSLGQAGWETEFQVLSPEDGFALSTDLLANRLREGYDLLFLCNPANPAGNLIPLAETERILSLCREHGTFLVLDEAFMDFREEESAKKLIAEQGGGIVLRSMTKFYAIPGLRLGYAIGAPEIIDRCRVLTEPWSVNTLAQAAGVAALAAGPYRSRTLAYVRRQREALDRGLRSLPGLAPYPSEANYCLVKIENGMTSGTLAASLLHRRIIIRDCANFIGLDDRFFRVAVRTEGENRLLLSALGEVMGR